MSLCRCLVALACVVASICFCIQAQNAVSLPPKCVPGFAKNPELWRVCKTQPCVLLLKEEPYVLLEENRDLVSTPFLCKNHTQAGLNGILFEMLQMSSLDDSTHCVFGGRDCSFQAMMSFLEAEKKHQFMFGSLWFLPERTSRNTRSSESLFEDPVVIVGHRNATTGAGRAFEVILYPFELYTWVVIFSFLFLAWCCHVLLATYFANPRSRINVSRHILFDFSRSRNSEPVRMLNTVATGTLLFTVTALSIICILFYEIAVVQIIFQEGERLETPMRNLTKPQLEKFTVVKGDGTQLRFRLLVDPDNVYANDPPWTFCASPEDCYKQLKNSSHGAQFFFTYENGHRHYLEGKGRDECRELPIFKTVAPVAAIPTGWYFGSAFPNWKRIQIDKAILGKRNDVQVFLNKKIPPSKCGIPKPRITPEVIGWLLLSVVLACMVPIGFAVIASILLRRRGRMRTDSTLLPVVLGADVDPDKKS